ncbi:hypothetical protein [Serpentovirinae sp. isolate K48]|uniref:Uncharacterized protein n=1 Tax=Serpentovirinae sp. isolate K48 TaxID=3071292 RepID=A0AAE6NYL8_9NIDO|nr:hypothetical protein QKQ98_gp8 [Serpentovirinae sp.]QFU19759.1 hypothetical protein [Serpentovirinae sp.]
MSIARLFKKPSYMCPHHTHAQVLMTRLSLRKKRQCCKDACKFQECQDKATQTNYLDFPLPYSDSRPIKRVTTITFKFPPPRPLGQQSQPSLVASVKPYRERLI